MSDQLDIGDAVVLEEPTAPTTKRRQPRSRRSGQWNRWSRLFHVYVSMACMLIVGFFAITGLTLNHPTWTLGSTTTTSESGTLPAGAVSGTDVDYLAISEYAREEFGISGRVKDYGVEGDNGHIDYAGPGYSASVSFTLTSSELTASTTQGDLLAFLNDVHKGRDTTNSWKWVIDVSAVLLIVITITGVGIQLFQSKRRRSALVTAGALAVVTVALVYLSR